MAAGGSSGEEAAVKEVAMEEKLQRVTSWLKKMFENQPMPQFEVSTQTADVLYELVEYSEERERDASFLVEEMKQRAAEYEAEAEYLQSLLTESLGLSPSSLSRKGTAYLNTLVDSAVILETKDTSLSSFFCAIGDRNLELRATESKNREMKQKLFSLQKKLTAVQKLEKKLEKGLEKAKRRLEVEGAKSESRLLNLQFLEDKSEDFRIRIKTIEEQLIATELDKSLMHQSLVSLSEKLAETREEIVRVKKNLELYLDLPPNLSIARVQVEEAKRELNALEEEFSKQIEMLTCGMREIQKL